MTPSVADEGEHLPLRKLRELHPVFWSGKKKQKKIVMVTTG